MSDYTQLTQEERYQIEALLKAGHPQSGIADTLNRDKSTISREELTLEPLRIVCGGFLFLLFLFYRPYQCYYPTNKGPTKENVQQKYLNRLFMFAENRN